MPKVHRCWFEVSLAVLLVPFVFGSCASIWYGPQPRMDGRGHGRLLLIGGGLDDDRGQIYERLVRLASQAGEPRILIATAASGDQQVEVTDKTEALRVWAPTVSVAALLRETSTAASVAAIDAATALLFTGGDQSRITARYRPDDQPTPEWQAMVRLLQRGGVIAGCSAGCAMMGQTMLLGGGSASALGIAPATAGTGAAAPLGPRVGPGMGFLPWAITDSHFFERDRVGRLVAALEVSGVSFGIGVGEDAACEIDIDNRAAIAVHGSALIVDTRHLQRDGATRMGVNALLLDRGWAVLDQVLPADTLPAPMPATPPHIVPVVEPGQNLQLASWRLFALARDGQQPGGDWQLDLDGWQVRAWPASGVSCTLCVGPRGTVPAVSDR